MRKCVYLSSLIFTLFVLFSSCAGKIEEDIDIISKTFSKVSQEDYYDALITNNVEETKQFLDANYDPDDCFFLGSIWEERNPLMVVSSTWLPNDNVVEMINLLVEYGADVNRLPYIWRKVYYDENESYIEFYNRVIKALLDNGADPNLKGLYAPFNENRYFYYMSMTEKKARQKFKSKKATTPLYEAIKKGIRWESQVDLLLQYGATLDESCLKAARLSGDEEMIKKIEELYYN